MQADHRCLPEALGKLLCAYRIRVAGKQRSASWHMALAPACRERVACQGRQPLPS